MRRSRFQPDSLNPRHYAEIERGRGKICGPRGFDLRKGRPDFALRTAFPDHRDDAKDTRGF
jgi:hypothetical protein